MLHPRFSREEIARRGEELYEKQLKAQVETPANIGKIISMDIESGDYEIGPDALRPAQRLLSRHPAAAIYGKRIGYNAVFSLGGTLTRTAD